MSDVIPNGACVTVLANDAEMRRHCGIDLHTRITEVGWVVRNDELAELAGTIEESLATYLVLLVDGEVDSFFPSEVALTAPSRWTNQDEFYKALSRHFKG